MTCFHPLSAFDVGLKTKAGKTKYIIRPSGTLILHRNGRSYTDVHFIPCGKCLGCQLDYARAWSCRIMLEASLYPDEYNHFVTLTYDDDHNPVTLVKKHLQDFFKRLRQHFPGVRIRYFACGEYGGDFGRPHYHAIIFNLPLPDLEPLHKTFNDGYFKSDLLSSIWNMGNVIIGSVSLKSASYTARYCMKKRGRSRDEKYNFEKHGLVPEFIVMSRKPGIGADAFDLKWFENNEIFISGQRFKPDRFFRDIFESRGFSYDPLKERFQYLQDLRISKVNDYFGDLASKEIELKQKTKVLSRRNYDHCIH